MKKIQLYTALSFLMLFANYSPNLAAEEGATALPADPQDVAISSDHTRQWQGYIKHRLGSVKNTAAIIPFQLAALSKAQQISGADFSIELLVNASNQAAGIDVYALPYRQTPTVLAGDFYRGRLDTTADLIQANFLDQHSALTQHHLSESGQGAFKQFIQKQYQQGATADDYIFIRLNLNTQDDAHYSYWEIAAQDHATAELRPSIALTTSQQGDVVSGHTYYCDPNQGKAGNDGSQAQPFASFASVDWASIPLQAGDTIYLLNGDHGRAYLHDLQFDDNVHIRALPGHHPRLISVSLINSQHIAFEGLIIDASGGEFAKETPMFYADQNSHYIQVEQTTLTAAEDISSWTKADWYAQTASGFQFRGSHITLKHNTINNTYHAMELRGPYSQVSHNLIDNFAGDAIRGLGSFSTYEYNVIRDCYINDYAIQHDDAFQTYNLSADPKVEAVTIRYNTILLFADPVTPFIEQHQLIGSLMQGIIITDGYADHWLVENNLVVNNMDHGISLYGARNSRVQNNTVIQSPLFNNTQHVPRIMLTTQRKTGQVNFNNIIRNNLASVLTTWTYADSSLVQNNVRINPNDRLNYLLYFADYEAGDFRLSSASPAIDAGLNIDVSQVDLAGKNRVSGGAVDAGAYEYP